MCLQDLAIGKRLIRSSQKFAIANGVFTQIMRARKDRVAIIICVDTLDQEVLVGYRAATLATAPAIATFRDGTSAGGTPQFLTLLAKDVGAVVTEELYAAGNGGTCNLTLTEIYPEPELSEAVAKEVARAF